MTQPGSTKPDPDKTATNGLAVNFRKVRAGLRGGTTAWLLAIAGGLAVAALGMAVAKSNESSSGAKPSIDSTAQKALYPVTINRPKGARMVPTSLTNFQGEAVMVSCSSCHTTTKPNLQNRLTQDLDQFHQGLQMNHGNLNCLSCHNSTDYETLRLADTTSVDFSDSMTLCSQCHGPQRRDYDMGLHGGMNGHWDLTKGGRIRNTCVNCHDPHAPAFPSVMPVLLPHDRISVQAKGDHKTSNHTPHP